MKLLFSGHFDTTKTPERVRFLSAMLAHMPGTEVTIFNQSGRCEAPFRVFEVSHANATDPNPKRALKALLDETISQPARARGTRGATGADLGAGRLLWEVLAENQIHFYSSLAPIRAFLRKLREFIRVIDEEKPDVAFLWNSFNVFHRFAREILRARGIRVAYFHDGVLPGSVAFDFDGEMGESWVSREPERFLAIPVNADELARATAYVEYIRLNNVNRHRQTPIIDFQYHLKTMGVAHKPLILMAGQQDWHAGLLPDNPNRHLHSPIYASSTDALAALDRVATDLGAHIIYKPHPLDRDPYNFLTKDKYRNVDIIQNGSIEAMIDAAAVTVTIASQACYTVAFRDRPCVLLGRNQMSFKGIADDLTDANDLGPCLTRAMARDHDPRRREALVRHVAQLNKSYLFDFGTLSFEYFDRTAADAARVLRETLTEPPTNAPADPRG